MLLKNQSKTILNQDKKESDTKSEYDVLFDSKINLFTIWYDESNLDRLGEYETCLERNINNNLINNIYVICEKVYPKQQFSFNSKIKFIYTENRPTYTDIFNLINMETNEFDINIISNTDIYFDNTLSYIESTLRKESVFCLTRWDVNQIGVANFHDRKDSQDVWIFRGNIKSSVYGDFSLGIAGCDNRIAHELKQAGYKLLNPSLSIKCYHLHNTGIRNYKDGTVVKRISPPYEFVTPSLLGSKDFSPMKKSLKSVLHIALNSEFQKSLGKALGTLGKYSLIDWRNVLKDSDLKSLHRKILGAVYEYKTDFIFMQIQTPDIITKQLIDEINKLSPNVFILNWNGDVRIETPEWMIELAKCKNFHTAFTNMRDVNKLQELGFDNTHFVPIGFEETIFNNKIDIMPKIPKIVFTGNNYGDKFPLTNLRMETISLLKRHYNDSFAVQGSGWGNYSNKTLSKLVSSKLYKNTKISISMNNINVYRYTSDRLYNIMACGCFALTHFCDGLQLDFENKKHLVYWESYKELLDSVKYYLSNEEERKQIADAGYKEVWSKHRWIHRIDKFKNEVLKW